MLVLSFNKNQRLIIGNDSIKEKNIIIQICEISNGKIKLGIDADRSIDIHREDVWNRINDN